MSIQRKSPRTKGICLYESNWYRFFTNPFRPSSHQLCRPLLRFPLWSWFKPSTAARRYYLHIYPPICHLLPAARHISEPPSLPPSYKIDNTKTIYKIGGAMEPKFRLVCNQIVPSMKIKKSCIRTTLKWTWYKRTFQLAPFPKHLWVWLKFHQFYMMAWIRKYYFYRVIHGSA